MLNLLRTKVPSARANCTRCGTDLLDEKSGAVQIIRLDDPEESLCADCHNSDQAQKADPH